jgi:hypothetical protein
MTHPYYPKIICEASAEPNFRQLLEEEAKELTAVGNNFMIRHTETTKIPIASSDHVDYLFQRMFAIIYLLLRTRGSVKVEDEDLLF